MEKDLAIKVDNVSKTFRIPHEKISSLRGAFVNAFKSHGYEEFKALDDVSFEVKKGEFFGIIGRNGSGKSTLLKILAGIYQPDKVHPVKSGAKHLTGGKIYVNGLISPFLELGIGFNPELSGRDNVYLNAAVLGLTHKQIDEKFDDIVEFSELRRFIDQKVKNYSSGMQVRLMFSTAIHANREILLMDEVLAVGDTNFQSKCLQEFNRYKDQGKTIVLVTHDIGTVQRYCDRAMLLRSGKIEMIGDPEKVGNKYIYQNMSDEEKRILGEEKRQRIKAEKEAERLAQEQRIAERRQQTEEEKRQQEEKRKLEEERRKKEEKKRNKVAEITKVEFLDKDGRTKNTFKTNDFVVVRIYYKINDKKNKECNVGVAFLDNSDRYVFIYNTDMDNFKLDKEKKFIDIIFDKMPLLKGDYRVNFAMFERSGMQAYEFLPNFKTIKMFSENKVSLYHGIIFIKHNWKQ